MTMLCSWGSVGLVSGSLSNPSQSSPIGTGDVDRRKAIAIPFPIPINYSA